MAIHRQPHFLATEQGECDNVRFVDKCNDDEKKGKKMINCDKTKSLSKYMEQEIA